MPSLLLACAAPSAPAGGAKDSGNAIESAACDTASAWYRDADGDGFGALLDGTTACAQPDGYVADAHAFSANNATFTAYSPEQGITAHFGADGPTLSRERDEIAVRTIAWGNVAGMHAVTATRPKLSDTALERVDPGRSGFPRVEYAGSGLTEWWAVGADGFEQGWTVAARPTGVGPLVIEMTIEGAAIILGDGDAWLHGDGGGEWVISGLGASDADGTSLDAHFDAFDAGLRITVDDANASYPVTIDPVYSAATATLTGSGSSSYFGYSVAGAGDVNADGYDDVIVGAYGWGSSAGRAYVYLGSASGISTYADTTLTGSATYVYFGASVACAGDVNGDGYDDVIVGAYRGEFGRGGAYVYLGSSSGVSTTISTTLVGVDFNDFFGLPVAAAGDVNADGYDDVIVGANGALAAPGEPYGQAYVYLGSATGLSSSISSTLSGGASSFNFGYSVSGAGDVDADGYDDVIVGDQAYRGQDGRAYVFAGSAGGVLTTATTTLDAAGALGHGGYFGHAVSGAGDVNGDGYDDVIVGAYAYYSGVYGEAYVYLGSASGIPTSAATTLDGESSYRYFASAVGGAGDVNRDGYDDLIVGALDGRAYVYAGSASGISSTVDTTFDGPTASIFFGSAVSGAGDVDGDGYDDVLVGAYRYSSNKGEAFVYHGYIDTDGDGYAAAIDCDDADASVNPAATEACDALDIDEDCNGLADNADTGATGQSTFYADADGDGYGGSTTASFCERPAGYAVDSTDCNDAAATVYLGASDAPGDGTDQDCDGVDTCYTDDDGDNYGTAIVIDGSSLNCTSGAGAPVATDCDDANPAVNPGTAETVADGVDQDCDSVDTCYVDADADGFGTAVLVDGSTLDCATGTGAAVATDCDDTAAGINPTATERCDPEDADEDCDGVADDEDPSATEKSAFYTDLDGDGFGGTTPEAHCDLASGYVSDSTDCDDASASAHPDAIETPADGVDQDCDGVDACYTDADGDNFGTEMVAPGTSLDCAAGVGAAVDTDCDDSSAAINPAATEVCDASNTDEDCNGLADDADAAVVGSFVFYADADGDGYGGAASGAACDLPVGFVSESTDCNDADATWHPGAAESDCTDPNDYNCDGAVGYADNDADGFAACVDCDDVDPNVFPGATDAPDDGVDQDCDGTDATAGNAGSLNGDDNRRPADEAGCACKVNGGPDVSWLAILGTLGAVVRRRRRAMTLTA